MDKTRDKMRRGGLPAPTDDVPLVRMGIGNRCSGCSEIIDTADEDYLVNVRGVALLRFHDVCYNAWATYSRFP